ncbi:hypothetical protein [Peribacillus frigoritolerans]|nr:hypothetical protein [Peribacillus frigoritolerans]MDM5306129.1 hypothetical protein [Peribacillus frigoritolerans]
MNLDALLVSLAILLVNSAVLLVSLAALLVNSAVYSLVYPLYS